jgi:DivIVA domain-containing protein
VTLLFTLLTLAVLGVIAAVATGRIAGGLEEPSTSLAPRGLPEGPVAPESLEAVRFSPALRGYRMEEVDAVLDRLGDELARRDRQILQLGQELRLAERAYVQRAARGAANPDWVTDTGSIPLTGSVPNTESLGVNGYPDQGAQTQPYPAQAYPGYGQEGQEYPGRASGPRIDDSDRREV